MEVATEVHEADLDRAAAEAALFEATPTFPQAKSEYDRSFRWPKLWRREHAMQTEGPAEVVTTAAGRGTAGPATLSHILEYDPREPVSALRLDAASPHSSRFRTVPTVSGKTVQILVDEEALAGNEDVAPAPPLTPSRYYAHDVLARPGPRRPELGSGHGDTCPRPPLMGHDAWLSEYDNRCVLWPHLWIIFYRHWGVWCLRL